MQFWKSFSRFTLEEMEHLRVVRLRPPADGEGPGDGRTPPADGDNDSLFHPRLAVQYYTKHFWGEPCHNIVHITIMYQAIKTSIDYLKQA